MKPRFKVCWLKEDDSEKDSRFVDLLNDGWMIFNLMPTEKAVLVVLTKMTDALDGLSMAVDPAITKKKNDKPTSGL